MNDFSRKIRVGDAPRLTMGSILGTTKRAPSEHKKDARQGVSRHGQTWKLSMPLKIYRIWYRNKKPWFYYLPPHLVWAILIFFILFFPGFWHRLVPFSAVWGGPYERCSLWSPGKRMAASVFIERMDVHWRLRRSENAW